MRKGLIIGLVLVVMLVGAATVLAAESMITAPGAGEDVWGEVDFEAVYVDADASYDAVQWAVRKGTCAAGVGTVLGNVDGHSDGYTWDGANFSATADVSGWDLGAYCFVFNPTEDAGAPNVRLTREFNVVEPCEVEVMWLPPVTNDSFAMKAGRTLPVKFELYDCEGMLADPVDGLFLVLHGPSSETAWGPGIMRWDLGYGGEALRFDDYADYYIANLHKDVELMSGEMYTFVVHGPDGSPLGEYSFMVVE